MYAQDERKLLFIGIDGVRSDALQQANTPVMDSLMANGISTFDSWHLGVTSSGPSWSNMCTGVWEAKHGVTNNSYTGSNFIDYPFFSNRMKEINPDLKCVQIITWNPMDDADKGTGGNVINADWDLAIDAGDLGQGLVTAAAGIQLLDPEIDVLFIHFDEPDAAGHGFGFSPSVPQYMNAIEGVDVEIGQVMQALRNRSNFANEDWLIVSTTDHGGSGTSHGGNSDDERHIWWYASSKSVPTMVLTGADPGSYQMPSNPVDPTVLKDSPVQVDIAVTAIDWMLPGYDPEANQAWDLDGKSWIPDSLDVVGLKSIELRKEQISIYPNPTNDQLNVSNHSQSSIHTVQLFDLTGKLIHTAGNIPASATRALNLSELEAGVYVLSLLGETGGVQKRVIVK